jgi:hypothetical protein
MKRKMSCKTEPAEGRLPRHAKIQREIVEQQPCSSCSSFSSPSCFFVGSEKTSEQARSPTYPQIRNAGEFDLQFGLFCHSTRLKDVQNNREAVENGFLPGSLKSLLLAWRKLECVDEDSVAVDVEPVYFIDHLFVCFIVVEGG